MSASATDGLGLALVKRVVSQITKRVAGEPIADPLVSLVDADARPIRKGKPGKPTQFGYVAQISEICSSTRRGQRGFITPVTISRGNPSENELLPTTITELVGCGLKPGIVAVDGGFTTRATTQALTPINARQLFIAGRRPMTSRSTRKRLARFRTGSDGRISHLKRAYGLGRSDLRDLDDAWAILAYNLDSYHHHHAATA